jgi:hypothetical protein
MFAISITWQKMGSSDPLAYQVLQLYQRDGMRLYTRYKVWRAILSIDLADLNNIFGEG